LRKDGKLALIGDRIHEAREHRNWTQDRLSREASISKSFLSDVENNKVSIGADYVLRIANALGVSLDYLMRGEEGREEREREPVTIPRSLSAAAEEMGWTFAQTLSLLDAHRAVVARRAARTLKEPTVDDWKALQRAIEHVYPNGSKTSD
jgi:transcriptional regulator with XRE-family HTH domain